MGSLEPICARFALDSEEHDPLLFAEIGRLADWFSFSASFLVVLLTVESGDCDLVNLDCRLLVGDTVSGVRGIFGRLSNADFLPVTEGRGFGAGGIGSER